MPRMTLKQFFARLPKDRWWLLCDTGIRRYGNNETYACCPITAALDPTAPTTAYARVATRAGMPEALARRIVTAADGKRGLTPTELRIRRLLLKHCGLQGAQS